MPRYRESLGIISTRGARANIPPRVWKTLDKVTLRHGTISAVVALQRVAGNFGCLTSERVFFICPSCGARAGSLGFDPFADPAVSCRKCGTWRSREFRVTKKAPHIRTVTSSIDRPDEPVRS